MNDLGDSTLDRQLAAGNRRHTPTLSAWDICRFEIEHIFLGPGLPPPGPPSAAERLRRRRCDEIFRRTYCEEVKSEK